MARRSCSLPGGQDRSAHSAALARPSTLLLVVSGIRRLSLTDRAGVPRAHAAATSRWMLSEWSMRGTTPGGRRAWVDEQARQRALLILIGPSPSSVARWRV